LVASLPVTLSILPALMVSDSGLYHDGKISLRVRLVLVVGTIRLIGSNANNVFSNTASSISQ